MIGSTVKGKFDDTASATEAALFEVIYKEKSSSEITLNTSKGFYIGLGSLVRIVVPEDELTMDNHRVVSKNISYGTSGTTCKLGLNRQPVLLSDYMPS